MSRYAFLILPSHNGPYRDFRHRVDRAISRDIRIGRKPAEAAASRP